jgi:hypothetical protein
MSYRKGFSTSDQYRDLAVEMFNAGFNSNAKRKDAMTYLSRGYEIIRRARDVQLREEIPYFVDGEINEELYAEYLKASDAYPMDLHNVRQAKHIDAEVFGDMTAQVAELVELRAAMKDADLVPASKNEAQIIIEQERAAAKAVKDDGFRLDQWITTQAWDCVSHLGNPYYRVNWYKQNEGLVSFARICSFVAPRREFWESKGKPNMSQWPYDQIENFYSEMAA